MRLGFYVNTHQAVPHMRLRVVAKHSRYRRCYCKTHLPFAGVASLLLSRPMSAVTGHERLFKTVRYCCETGNT